MFAVAVSAAVTVVVPPGASVPPVPESDSQPCVTPALQVREDAPLLVSVLLLLAGENGPPAPPLKTTDVPGVICRLSAGPASASISALPAGVPQPVQRSSPATAEYFDGLVVLKLFPVVVSRNVEA